MATKNDNIYILPTSTYDPWISIKKMLGQGVIVAGTAFVTYLLEVGLPNLQLELPEYAGIIGIVSAILIFFSNKAKHSGDLEVREVNKDTGTSKVVYKKVGNKIEIGTDVTE